MGKIKKFQHGSVLLAGRILCIESYNSILLWKYRKNRILDFTSVNKSYWQNLSRAPFFICQFLFGLSCMWQSIYCWEIFRKFASSFWFDWSCILISKVQPLLLLWFYSIEWLNLIQSTNHQNGKWNMAQFWQLAFRKEFTNQPLNLICRC